MRVLDLAKKYKMNKDEFLELIDRYVGVKGKKTISGLSKAEVEKIELYIARKINEKISAQTPKEVVEEKKPAKKKVAEKSAEEVKKTAVKKKDKEPAVKTKKKTEKEIVEEKKPAKKKVAEKSAEEVKKTVAKKKDKEPAIKTKKKTEKEIVEEKKPAKKKVTEKPAEKVKKTVAKKKDKESVAVVEKEPLPAERAIEVAEKEVLESPEAKPLNIIILEGTENIKELSEKIGIPSAEIIKHLFSLGQMLNINQSPGKENLKKLSEHFGFIPEFKKVEIKREKKEVADDTLLIPRAPVVTIMGHVDHGKTTILDTIRKSRIAAKEHGQITQKIGAYKLQLKEDSLVFLDTPGHESFTAMRARGTLVTDIVILVVAADEGIKPQTVEAINHAKSANVPIIVAVNKIDKPDINLDKIKKQLAEYNLVPEEWGGDTVFVNLSGLTGEGIDELLEMLILVGEMLELKATPEGEAEGVVVESFIDRTKGSIVNALIRKGTLKVGDPFIAGKVRGRVRAIIDDWGKQIESAGPSTPVEILGGNGVAVPGEEFRVMKSDREVRQALEERVAGTVQRETTAKKMTLQDLYAEIQRGEMKDLNLIIKTDYAGTIDAIRDVIGKIPLSEVQIVIIHAETGAITESDILLASASNAIVVGFNVPLSQKVEDVAKTEGVEVRSYRVIYELAEDIRKAVEGMLEPEEQEVLMGQAVVKKVFRLSDKTSIAGSLVVDGKITRGSIGKVVRGGSILHQGQISSLKRFKENVKEVKHNTECGIGVDNFTDFMEGDVIQSYIKTKIAKKL